MYQCRYQDKEGGGFLQPNSRMGNGSQRPNMSLAKLMKGGAHSSSFATLPSSVLKQEFIAGLTAFQVGWRCPGSILTPLPVINS